MHTILNVTCSAAPSQNKTKQTHTTQHTGVQCHTSVSWQRTFNTNTSAEHIMCSERFLLAVYEIKSKFYHLKLE